MTGSFVSYIAGYVNFFRAMSIYMILDNHPFVRLIFQKVTNYVHTFIIGCLYFELLQVGTDSCIYRVR